jgi:hypothetical protein
LQELAKVGGAALEATIAHSSQYAATSQLPLASAFAACRRRPSTTSASCKSQRALDNPRHTIWESYFSNNTYSGNLTFM